MMRTLIFVVVIPAFMISAWLGCSSGGSSSPNSGPQISQISRSSCDFISSGYGSAGTAPVHANKWITGLNVPWALAFLPNSSDALVTERAGTIRLIQNGQLVTAPVASITVTSSPGTEQGLLGLALDPQFSSNSYFYVYNTVSENGTNVNRLDRYVLSSNHTSATFSQTILDGVPSGSVHNGGRIKFGPDGNLYIGTGETENGPLAQDTSSPAGKILRITSSGQAASGNPIAGNPYYVMGVRNVMAFDWVNPQTMIVAEHGPTGEVNDWYGHDRIEFVAGGENFGWPNVYGCGGTSGSGGASGGTSYATPALSYDEAVPPGGGLYYTGSAIPEWKGSFLVGTLISTFLGRYVPQSNPYGIGTNETYFNGTYGRLRDVEQGPDGNVYVTTSNCDGRGTCPSDGDYILQVVHN
jgi:glucose/arabinose dehydrogenase